MNLNKPNDIFVTKSLTPNATVNDLVHSDMVSDNTSFFDRDYYKDTDFAKEIYKNEDGSFDEVRFNEAYDSAAKLYGEISDDEFIKNNIEWDAFDITKPKDGRSKSRDIKIEDDINPFKNEYGRSSLDSVDMGELSVRELAQKSKIWDTAKGEFREESANDLGLFGSWFDDTLVYAQWDEDGQHLNNSTGRMVSHQAREYKLNDENEFYIETLDGRDVSGKQVVNPTDLITAEGSMMNKVDFFDSDGRDKSVIGTTFKLATELAPMLIPGFNTYYGGFKMAKGLASVLPTFYKSIEGILLGDTTVGNETDLWKAATKAQGFMAKYNQTSFSDNSQDSLWNYEQLGDMVVTTLSQVYEQRAAAKLSNLFYKTNTNPEYLRKLASISEKELTKSALSGSIRSKATADKIATTAASKIGEIAKVGEAQSKLAKSLSLGYMAMTSSSEMYQEALNSGYDRRTAGLTSLLAAGGMYGLMMNNRMGDWFLDKTTGYTVEGSRAAVRKGVDQFLPQIEKAVKAIDVNEAVGKKGLAKVITSFKKSVNDIFVNSNTTEGIWKNSMVESIEELSEEVLMDATRGVVDTMGWLGMTSKRGNFNTIEKVFSTDGLSNYLTAMFGGAIGGGIFEINRLKIEPFLSGKVLEPETQHSLLRLVANGKSGELKAEIDKRVKAMGNSKLAPVLTTAEDGKDEYLFDENSSQALIIAESSKKYIDHLDDIMNAENLKNTDEDIIKKAILNEIKISDLEELGGENNIHGFILSDYNEITDKILETRAKISELENTKEEADKDTNSERINKKSETTPEIEKPGQTYTELNEELKKYRDQIKSIMKGEKADYYKQLSIFSLNRNLHKPFISLNIADFTSKKYGKNFYELPDSVGTLTKDSVQSEFDDYLDSEGNFKTKMKFMFDAFDEVNKKFSNSIGEYAEEKHSALRDKYINVLTNSEILPKEKVEIIQEELKKSGLPVYGLDESYNYELGTVLIENGHIDTSNLEEEDINKLKKFLNSIQLPYQDLNPEFLSRGFEAEKKANLDEIQKKINTEIESGVEPSEANAKYLDEIIQITKMTPVFKRPNSSEVIPIELDFINSQIDSDSDIPAEVAEVVKRRVDSKLNKLKESVKNSIVFDVEDYEEVSIEEYNEAVQSDVDMTEIKNKVDSAETFDDVFKIVKELESYVNNLEGDDLKLDYTNQLSTIDVDGIDQIYLDSEKKINSKNSIDNKLLQLLAEMQVELFSVNGVNKTNVLNILGDELDAFKMSDTPQEYTRSKDVVDSMKKSLETIDMALSINDAMLSTEIDQTNPYGFNVSMQNMSNKAKERNEEENASQELKDSVSPASSYKTVDSKEHTLLSKELNKVAEKLNFLIQLSESNQSTIATVQEEIRSNSQELLLEQLIKEDSPISVINIKIDGEKLVSEEALNTILADGEKSQERKLYDVEELIYKSFKKHYENNPDSALEQVFSAFNNDDFKKDIKNYTDEGFTRKMSNINTLDYFNYLHTLLASNSKKFYNSYKNLLENEVSLDSDKKAPFFGQEFSIRQTYAYRTNKRIMAHSVSFIEKLLGSGQIFLKNSLIVPGSAGTGKTNVVSNFAWRLDPTKDTKVIVSAPSNDVLEKLKQDISKGKESDVDSFTKQELFKKILGENYDSFYEAVKSLENRSKEGDNFSDNFIKDTNDQNVFTINDISKYHVDIVDDFLNKLTNNFSKDHDTVIYIDEVSWMNPFELSIIDHISSMEGSRLYLIGLGDELQNGYTLNDETPFSLDTFYYNHPPKMKSVIRTANVHKQSNVESLEIALKNRMSNLTNPKKFGIQPITLNYFESDNSIQGDKAVDTLQVSDVKKFKGGGEVVAITDDGSLTSEQQAVFNEAGLPDVKVIARDNVQGKEFDQVISLYKIPYVDDKVSLYNANKQLYTLLSRGKKNTLIVGNNELLSKLQIEPEKKDTTSKIELMMGQIDTLLDKRIEFLNQLDDYVEEETKVVEEEETDGEVIIEEEKEADIHENNKPIVENDDSDNKPEEIVKMTQEDYDGNQVFMAYSFYNMLNAKVGSDGELIVNPETDDVLSDMQFLSQISNAVKKDKSKEDLINDFIIAKNHLLHGLPIPVDKDNVFKNVLSMFSDDSKLVVRKITQSEFTLPYAKNAHMKDDNGNDRSPNIGDPALFLALKTTFNDKNGDEKTGYVTLAALPDLDNENWKQVKNKEFLQTISNQLEDQQDVEIDAELNPLTGIRTIFEDGTSKAPKENNISITGNTLNEFTKNLNKIMPGLIVPNMNSLDVFDDNEQNIKDEFAKTGYKLAENKEPIENVKPFRFRPYVKVSYINPKDDSYSKLMVFQAKKRSLIEAKKEYDELQSEYELIRDNKIEAEKYIKNKFPSLISRWNGIVLLSDVLSFFEQDQIVDPETGTMKSKSDEIMNRLLEMEVEYAEGDSQLGIVNAFKDMLKVIKDSDYDVSKLSNDDKRKLLGRIKGGSTLSNLGLRLFDVMSLDEITDFAESQDSEYEVYYNPLWQSKNDESHTAKLDGEDFIKHLELNAYLEPPVFTLKINNIVETKSEGEMENEPEINEVEDDLDESPLIERKIFTTPFIRNNKPLEVEIDLSKWKGNEEQLNMALNSVDGGLKTIKDNLSSLDSNMISIEEATELVGENTYLLEGLSNGEEVDLNNILINMVASTIKPVLSNTVMFDTNNNLVAEGLLNIYKGMIENNNDIADLYDTIDDHIEDGGDFTIDDFFLLSGITMKAPTTIDNELNKKLCK